MLGSGDPDGSVIASPLAGVLAGACSVGSSRSGGGGGLAGGPSVAGEGELGALDSRGPNGPDCAVGSPLLGVVAESRPTGVSRSGSGESGRLSAGGAVSFVGTSGIDGTDCAVGSPLLGVVAESRPTGVSRSGSGESGRLSAGGEESSGGTSGIVCAS